MPRRYRGDPEKDKIDALKYNFEEIDNDLVKLLGFAAGKTIVRQDLDIENVEDVTVEMWGYTNELFNYYGRGSLDNVESAIEFNDGSALMCCTTSAFAGTFASHSETTIRYFALTPKGS